MSTGERYFKTASIILLIMVLLISWSALSATRTVRQQVQSLQGELHSLRNQVTHEVGSIRGTVQSMHEDSRWYNVPRFEVTKMDGATAMIKLSWNLQEYTKGNTVTLSYRYADQTAFSEIGAVEESNGLFAVEFPLQITMEPNWNLSVSKAAESTTNRKENLAVVTEEKVWGPGYSPMLLEYYITLHEGETIRTSGQHTMSLDKLGYNYFNPLNVRLIWDEEEKLEVALTQLPNNPEPYFTIKNIYLESRRGKTETLERWPFVEAKVTYPQTAPAFALYNVTASPGKDYDSLFIVVEYSKGVSVEKEIHPI